MGRRSATATRPARRHPTDDTAERWCDIHAPLGMLVLSAQPSRTLGPAEPPDYGASQTATPPMVLLPTHTPPPPLGCWPQVAARASGTTSRAAEAARRRLHQQARTPRSPPPGTSEDVASDGLLTGFGRVLGYVNGAYATIAMIRT